jgi:hypothetical protein
MAHDKVQWWVLVNAVDREFHDRFLKKGPCTEELVGCKYVHAHQLAALITKRTESEVLGENLPHCQFIYHTPQT